jgi:hypothetical protein
VMPIFLSTFIENVLARERAWSANGWFFHSSVLFCRVRIFVSWRGNPPINGCLVIYRWLDCRSTLLRIESFSGPGLVVASRLRSDSVWSGKNRIKKPLSLFRRLTIDLVDLLVLNLGFRLSCVLVSMCGRRMFRLKSSIHCGLDQWLSFFEFGRIYKFNSIQIIY